MQEYQFPRSFLGAIAASAVATLAVAVFAVTVYGLEFGSAEEGPLETVQEWFLAVAFIQLAAAAVLQPAGAPRLASVCGATLALVFFFRELEPVGHGPIATYLQSDAFRIHEAIAIAVAAALLLPANWRFVPEIVRWLAGRSSWPFLLAGAFILVGEWIDGEHAFLGVEWLPRAIEETSETFAYAVILASTTRWHATARAMRSKTDPREAVRQAGRG